MSQSYFIIGTDTNVGKTYIASALVKKFVGLGFKTIGMKPVASGCQYNENHELINDDVTALLKASTVTSTLDAINPYRCIPAIAPHIAAEQTLPSCFCINNNRNVIFIMSTHMQMLVVLSRSKD